MQAELNLSQQLKRCLKVVKKSLLTWDQTIQESRPCTENIGNLADQLECCQRIKLTTTPLKNFDNLEERLIGKLITSVENEMTNLIRFQHQLLDVSERLAKENEKCMNVYHRQRGDLPLEVMVNRMPFRPSYADMLEMIAEIDRMCHELSATRSYHLDNLDYNKPASIQETMILLRKLDKLQEKMEGKLARVQYFLDDDFSTEMEMPAID